MTADDSAIHRPGAFPIDAVMATLAAEMPRFEQPLIDQMGVEGVDPFRILVATILSLRTKDTLTAVVAPRLFAAAATPEGLLALGEERVAELIYPVGFYRNKARSLMAICRALLEQHCGRVPADLGQLLALPGVGRKTANLILGECFGAPEGVVVDTHVLRLAQRLGLSASTKPEVTERDLAALYPRELWMTVTHTLIFHGRRVCLAVKPACASCGASGVCPSAFDAVHVGRKS
jgi:endonuclease III